MGSIYVDLLGSQVRYYGNRFRTRAIEAGEGEALILLHGVGGHAEAYSRNVVRLGRHYRTLAIDLAWHGLSSKPPYQSSIPTWAAQVIDLMDAIGVQRAHIEGESLGGWIGIWLALHHRERIQKLILNTTAGVRFDPGIVPERPEEGRQLLRQRSLEAISQPTLTTIRRRLEWLMASPDRVTDELVALRHALYSDPETQSALKEVFANSFGDGDSRQFQIPAARLQEVSVPTLVLWTDKNPGAGPEVGKHISSLIPGSRFQCIAGAAHWPQWEQPEEHDRIVIDFLKGAPNFK